jgi:hypothetical protein
LTSSPNHNPLQTYTENDPNWLSNSWRHTKWQIFEYMETVLAPVYELTFMGLDWRGHAEHSWLELHVWYNRTHRMTFRLVFMPVLISIFRDFGGYAPEEAKKMQQKTATNLKEYLYEQLGGTPDWKVVPYLSEIKRLEVYSKLRPEELIVGKFQKTLY